MTKMPGEFKYKQKVWVLSGCAALLTLSYLGLFGMTIMNTLKYQNEEKNIGFVTADISQMEFTYLSKEAQINPDYAASLGFVEPSNIVIARRSDSAVTAFAPGSSIE